MQVIIKNRRVQFELSSMIISFLISGWAGYYYYDTLTSTDEGPETVLFIRPIFWAILICLPFVLWSAVTIQPFHGSPANRAQSQVREDRGILDRRRIFFVSTLAGYSAAIVYFGYLIPSALYLFLTAYYLGSRSMWILLVLPIGLSVFLSIVFRMVLMVPIDIWPTW